MLIQDTLYGEVAVHEPVLVELLESRPLIRLRGVMQHGISGLVGLTPPINRLEHSIGVMLLVRRMGGNLVEQIAALLHDVSHTAFSHVMDHVFDSAESQSFHDRVKPGFFQQTELPDILRRHGQDWRILMDEERFPLLEQPSPALCADRIDYFLRDAVAFNFVDPGQVGPFLDRLVVWKGRLALDDIAAARWMGETYLRTDDHSWSNFNEVGLYELTAEALRYGFEQSLLKPEDIWLTDEALWGKMRSIGDAGFQKRLAQIRPDVQFVWDAENPTFILSTKIRTLDPDVVIDGHAHPLSVLDPSFALRRASYLQRKQGDWPMRLVDKR